MLYHACGNVSYGWLSYECSVIPALQSDGDLTRPALIAHTSIHTPNTGKALYVWHDAVTLSTAH